MITPRRGLVSILVTAAALTMSVMPAQAATVTLPDDKKLSVTGGWKLKVGSAGHKVAALQEALGYSDSAWEVYTTGTAKRVRQAQRRLGLPVTGKVNRATWRALEVDGRWRMDGFNQRPRTDASSTRRERVEVMIATARRYLGSEYVWGGSGTPKRGVDCSGLVLQAMYSAGLHPSGVSLRRHQTNGYSTTDAMLADPGLKHIPLSKAKRGDLVFFTSNSSGRVNHVAIVLGPNRVIEAVEPKVRRGAFADRSSQSLYPVAIRPFPHNTRM